MSVICAKQFLTKAITDSNEYKDYPSFVKGYIRITKKGHNSGTLWLPGPQLHVKHIYTSYGSCVASFIQMT